MSDSLPERNVVNHVGSSIAAIFAKGQVLVQELSNVVDNLNLGNESQLRKNVWNRELNCLRAQKPPTTLIAICGPTGAGKSSLLNAILDDQLVPTSAMQACTAVVTEIGYHEKPNAEADIIFLSRDDWIEEFSVLRRDLLNDDGSVKHSSEFNTDAKVAWEKIHAVYPTLTPDMLATSTTEEILVCNPASSMKLGTTELVLGQDTHELSKQVSLFIGTREDRRSKQKTAPKSQHHNNGKVALPTLEPEAPAFWPLIRQVKIRCHAPALATGAVLVDLPGVADANAARSSIAQSYMKKCDRIWIVSNISRAKDSKPAKDILGHAFSLGQILNGRYDNDSITFIATHCDVLTCSDVIRSLHLDDETDLQQLEEQLDNHKHSINELQSEKKSTEYAVKASNDKLKKLKAKKKQLDIRLKVLKKSSKGTKRKSKFSESLRVKKRREDPDEGLFGYVPADTTKVISDESGTDDDLSNTSESEHSDFDNGSESELEENTIEGVASQIARLKSHLKEVQTEYDAAKVRKRIIKERLAVIDQESDALQREKNAFCSLKRSEVSRALIQEEFRKGLKEFDDSTAEKNDPLKFDPSKSVRNYEAIDLPVFTCSSADYVKLTDQSKGDGKANCFQNIEDTGIPSLQQWCHEITLSLHERGARALIAQLEAFSSSIQAYMREISETDAQGCEALRTQWQSPVSQDSMGKADADREAAQRIYVKYNIKLEYNYDDDFHCLGKSFATFRGEETKGISSRLTKEFIQIVDDHMEELGERFKEGLEDKCRVGASKASEAAVAISNKFAQEQAWNTYRASLSRLGVFRRNLNAELIEPFIATIARSWAKMFETDLFASYEEAVMSRINQIVHDMVTSSVDGLKRRVAKQGAISMDDARVAARKALENIRQTMHNEQKEISRCFAPHIQSQLKEGYSIAMAERGPGSVARQKEVFRQYVDDSRHSAFSGGAQVMLERLSASAEAIGTILKASLLEVAEKVEAGMSALWEGGRDDPEHVKICKDSTLIVEAILAEISLLEVELNKLRVQRRPLGEDDSDIIDSPDDA